MKKSIMLAVISILLMIPRYHYARYHLQQRCYGGKSRNTRDYYRRRYRYEY
jgi:hypothetical protein